MPDAGDVQTKDGTYEDIYYFVFEGVDYPRTMSWEASNGSIGIGDNPKPQDTNKAAKGITLEAGKSLVVWNTKLKLV